jgi:hypothetical protein
MKIQTLVPAYGRDYKSAEATKLSWENGADFKLQPQGCYCSIRDIELMKQNGITDLNIRYKSLKAVLVIKLE